MGSTERNPKRGEGAGARRGDSYESLRHAFHVRLGSERVHFVSLSASLARAEEDPNKIFEALQFRAHRLQGGAAIFEESEVSRAAGVLEQAAVNAAQARARNTDEAVWMALEALVSLMGKFSQQTAAA